MVKKSLIVIALLGVCWCFAETFLLEEKPRRRSPAQLKEEIINRMGTFLEQESKSIELRAQIQQRICKHIREYAQNDKNSFLKNASTQDLQKILKRLVMEQERYTKEHGDDERFLAMLQASIVV